MIDDEGNQVGVMKTPDALVFAQERDLDLVEVAPEARPPVCRVLDYSKYKYEQAQKVKQAKKHQQQITVREIKFRPKIAEHDYDTKKHHVERFLKHKDKVKVTIMFRGREVTHPERGTMILDRLAEELAEMGVVEQRPMQEGRNMTMMMAPSKAVLAGTVDSDAPADGETPAAATEAPAENGAQATASAPPAENGAGAATRTSRRPWTARTRRRQSRKPRLTRAPVAAPCHNHRAMPKMKTHSGAKKRFKVTGTGKVRGRHPFTSHILEKKSPKKKRALGGPKIMSDDDTPRIKRMLGVGK